MVQILECYPLPVLVQNIPRLRQVQPIPPVALLLEAVSAVGQIELGRSELLLPFMVRLLRVAPAVARWLFFRVFDLLLALFWHFILTKWVQAILLQYSLPLL